MRVLLLGFTKIAYMPYMHFYMERLQKENCEVHLLCWERDNLPDANVSKDITVHAFNREQEDSVPLLQKFPNFYKYRRFAKEIIRKYKFDLIIVLHSTPGVLLLDVLTGRYNKKYVLDYRDVTYEDYGFYRSIIARLVNCSAATFVSSDAFRKFLPHNNNIYTSHNITLDSLDKRNVRRYHSRQVTPLRIRFWGFIRHRDINVMLIDRLANDNRFELHYHGREQRTGEFLKNYCRDNKFTNIFFHGEYHPADRFVFATETDLLHNMYENDMRTTNAMGNKYYDGVTLYVPQLCTKESFMGKQVEQNCVGIALNPCSKRLADEIFDYYNALNWSCFEQNCDTTLENILGQYNDGVTMFEGITNGR